MSFSPSKLPSIQSPTTPTYYRNFPTNTLANYKLKPTPKPTGPSKISPMELPSASKNPTVMPSPHPSISTSPLSQRALDRRQTNSLVWRRVLQPRPSRMPSRLKIPIVGIRSIKEVLDWKSAMASFYTSVYNNDGSLDDDVMVYAVVTIQHTNRSKKVSRRTRQQRLRQSFLGRMLQQLSHTLSVVLTYSQTMTCRTRDPNLSMNKM